MCTSLSAPLNGELPEDEDVGHSLLCPTYVLSLAKVSWKNKLSVQSEEREPRKGKEKKKERDNLAG